MKLASNIRGKMRAYSICTLILIGLTFWGPEQYYAITGRDINPYHVGYVMLFLIVFGTIGWFIDQHKPSLWRTFKLALISLAVTAGILFLLALPAQAMAQVQPDPPPQGLPTWAQTSVYALPLVARWEGLETTAYLDRIASPPVWTVCHGETFNVAPNEVRTVAQCTAGLSVGLRRYWVGYRSGVTLDALAPQTDAAMASLAWNIGIGATLRSTAVRRLNAGDIAGACAALTWFNKSGGRIIRGLVNRRADEQATCLIGAA